MSRVVGNWLKAYLEYTKESESPEIYHIWTGLSIIASVLQRDVRLDMGLFTLFPHLYVVLVGPPGKVAKSTTIRLGRNLLLPLDDINFGPDSVTREELIRQLGKLSAVDNEAKMVIHSAELSSLIEPSGIGMIQFLIEAYDGDIKFDYATKHSGKDKIKNISLNLLGATTPSWIAEGLPAEVVGHGFTSRVIFVYAEEPRFANPFPAPLDRDLMAGLITDLEHMGGLRSVYTFSDEAKEIYSERYEKIMRTRPSDYRTEGFHWRKRTHLLKVATLLAVAESDADVVEARDVKTAWALLEKTEKKMARAFSAVGKYEHASDLERILASIQEAGGDGLTAQQIYDENYAVGDVKTVANILSMLCAMGRVERDKRNDVNYYVARSPEYE